MDAQAMDRVHRIGQTKQVCCLLLTFWVLVDMSKRWRRCCPSSPFGGCRREIFRLWRFFSFSVVEVITSKNASCTVLHLWKVMTLRENKTPKNNSCWACGVWEIVVWAAQPMRQFLKIIPKSGRKVPQKFNNFLRTTEIRIWCRKCLKRVLLEVIYFLLLNPQNANLSTGRFIFIAFD